MTRPPHDTDEFPIIEIREGDDFAEVGGESEALDVEIEDRRDRFERLAREWEDGTEFFSSTKAMTQHPDFAELVAMGEEIIPWVLRRYEHEKDPGHWWLVLAEITGEAPEIPKDKQGKLAAVRQAWLEWGRRRG